MIEKGDLIKLTIEKCVFGGDGMGRTSEGQIVFVPETLPGEKVVVEITALRKNFLRGKVVHFGETSDYRINIDLPVGERTPPCVYLHTTYEYETELKMQQLKDFMTQKGIEDFSIIAPPIAPEPALGYRNKIVLHVNKDGSETQIGYVGDDNQSVTKVTSCPLAHPAINEKLAELLSQTGFYHSVHNKMDITFRYTENDGVKFWRNAAPRNSTWLKESTSIGLMSVPLDGFFQVNMGGAEVLITELKDYLDKTKPECYVDLFCGVGFFAAVAAEMKVKEIYGVELSEDSIAAANYNLKQRNREDAKFFAADAARIFPDLLQKFPEKTLLAVDPPRNGLPHKLTQAIVNSDLNDMVYISCNPSTWIRDVGRLAKGGWKLNYVRLINQFARTAHFELFSCFHR